MEKKPAIQSLLVQNLLSFGDRTEPLELHNLNVLIGPNGSGKSNLIEIIGLLHNAPTDLAEPIRIGGGINEWLWKGAPKTPTARIEVTVSSPRGKAPLRYSLRFTRAGRRLEVTDERIEDAASTGRNHRFYFAYIHGRPILRTNDGTRQLRREEIDPQLSILSQRKSPELYPEVTHIGQLFGKIRLYRDWEFGGVARVREPCAADLPTAFLEEDASNVGVVLSRLLALPGVNRQLLERLRMFYEDTVSLHPEVQHGLVETSLEEKHLRSTVPLRRLSDGTIRWLALLTILLHPKPPPLVCIEEPELGLHPDMVHEVGKLLLEASDRMQLIVTTHSDLLIEEFQEVPESVVVCEKQEGTTAFRRLDRRELSGWLREYSLGQLWRKGQIGGNRW